MADPIRQIRDGGVLQAVPAPTQRPAVTIADVDATPVESPVRALHEKIHASFRLPRETQPRDVNLPTFVLGALLLWGCTLGGVGALLIRAAI